MYIHIGKDLVIRTEEIISIFNLDYIKNTKEYKNFYKNLEEKKKIINIAENQEKTFILAKKQDDYIGYITNIGANTIGKRKKNRH